MSITYILLVVLVIWVVLKLTGVVLGSGLFWTVLAVVLLAALINALVNRGGPRL